MAADRDSHSGAADPGADSVRHTLCATTGLRRDGDHGGVATRLRQCKRFGLTDGESKRHPNRDGYTDTVADRHRNSYANGLADRDLDAQPDTKPHANSDPMADGHRHQSAPADQHSGALRHPV